MDHSHRLPSCDISLAVRGGVDCGRRRRNVYDKKPQRYAKDNRTAHLTARSDKSVAYVTNSKRLYTRRVVLLKLTIDRHEASRGLLATAELLLNFISQTDDIEDVIARTVGEKVDLLAPGDGSDRSTPPLGYGPGLQIN